MLKSWMLHLLAVAAIIFFLGFYLIPGAGFGFYFISVVSGILLMILCHNEMRADSDKMQSLSKKRREMKNSEEISK
ncbi:hypothetical protein [Fictibacillus fluitans]|uniref:Uncharacterized protein n=1 Tax=Fictibacillus fluitans TaxID=3058422 RepID=A0ABT8HSM5_9BACL|nr:hypothetical protein [Fictibacillus sp. NE201]MDN4523763.1 hypothetical protein [Fictibacillus sp. NE201]